MKGDAWHMGTFAGLFQKAGSGIPEEKKAEFRERVEKLFQAGGMMELNRVQLYDKAVGIIRKASMHERGMDFYYNYFEDDVWENAGFCTKDCCVSHVSLSALQASHSHPFASSKRKMLVYM